MLLQLLTQGVQLLIKLLQLHGMLAVLRVFGLIFCFKGFEPTLVLAIPLAAML